MIENTPFQANETKSVNPRDQLLKQTKLSFLKQHSITLLISLVVFLSLVVVYLYPITTVSPSPKITEDDFYLDVKSVFLNKKEKYKSQLHEGDKLSIWWISEDGLNIINDNSVGIEFYSFNCESDLHSNSVFKEVTQLIGSQIDKVMIQNGYKLNQRNSSKSIDDDQFYDYVQAYERGPVKAVFTANPDCATFSSEISMHYTFSFVFTDELETNYQEQAQYLKDLGINNATIHVKNKVDDFVNLNVYYRRTGHYTIAKLINGKWTELFSRQDRPSCEMVKKYSIPKDIIFDCYPGETNN